MFRRPGKSPLDENNSPYSEESANGYKYNKQADAPYGMDSNRLFDQQAAKNPTPLASSYDGRRDDGSMRHHLPHHLQGIAPEEPETTLGEGVTFRGELSFERLLRIDGTFEGELLSEGKLIVGPKGVVKSSHLKLREAVIEGKVEGNITVQERLELRGEASVQGDIVAKFLSVDEGVRLKGHVLVTMDETPS